MDQDQKDWIDNVSYEQLLHRWRFSKSGDEIFQGEAGEYYSKVMNERRALVGNAEHVRLSKKIG